MKGEEGAMRVTLVLQRKLKLVWAGCHRFWPEDEKMIQEIQFESIAL